MLSLVFVGYRQMVLLVTVLEAYRRATCMQYELHGATCKLGIEAERIRDSMTLVPIRYHDADTKWLQM